MSYLLGILINCKAFMSFELLNMKIAKNDFRVSHNKVMFSFYNLRLFWWLDDCFNHHSRDALIKVTGSLWDHEKILCTIQISQCNWLQFTCTKSRFVIVNYVMKIYLFEFLPTSSDLFQFMNQNRSKKRPYVTFYNWKSLVNREKTFTI